MILFLGGIGKAISSVANAVGKAIGGPVGDAVKGAGGLLGGVADTFSKIGGGGLLGTVGGLLGGPAGAIAGKILGSIAGFGSPPLPGGFGGMLGKLPEMISKGINAIGKFQEAIAGGPAKLFQKGLNFISEILGKLGAKQPQLPTLTQGCGHSQNPGVASPGGTSSTGGTGGTSSSGKTGDGLMDAASRAYDQLGGIEKEIQNLNPDDPDYQKKLMLLQNKMQKTMQMIQLIANMQSMMHQMAMGVIQKMQ